MSGEFGEELRGRVQFEVQLIVRVSVAKQDETHLWLSYRISDTGIGIDGETQKHLFEVFRQGDGSRTRRFGGTGIGPVASSQLPFRRSNASGQPCSQRAWKRNVAV